MTEKMIAQLKAGITVEGIKYAPIEVTVEKPNGTSNYWVVVRLQEGKNREIRKVFAHFGIQVSRLIRTAYGPYKLNWLTPKDVVEVKI
jgi:23S rRNA pseudouridine2605 synthase